MSPVPFTIRFAGRLARAEGLVRFDGTALLMEFECCDALVGMLRTGLREVRVPAVEVDSLQLHRGLWSTTLDIQTTSLRATRSIPGSSHGRFTLTFSREHRDEAARMAAAIDAARQEAPGHGR